MPRSARRAPGSFTTATVNPEPGVTHLADPDHGCAVVRVRPAAGRRTPFPPPRDASAPRSVSHRSVSVAGFSESSWAGVGAWCGDVGLRGASGPPHLEELRGYAEDCNRLSQRTAPPRREGPRRRATPPHPPTTITPVKSDDQSDMVMRSTSSTVVTPSAILVSPLRRSVLIPPSIAARLISALEAPLRMASRIGSVIGITS